MVIEYWNDAATWFVLVATFYHHYSTNLICVRNNNKRLYFYGQIFHFCYSILLLSLAITKSSDRSNNVDSDTILLIFVLACDNNNRDLDEAAKYLFFISIFFVKNFIRN